MRDRLRMQHVYWMALVLVRIMLTVRATRSCRPIKATVLDRLCMLDVYIVAMVFLGI